MWRFWWWRRMTGLCPRPGRPSTTPRTRKVPIVVAINKIDKPTAQPDRVKRELSEQGLVPEEWGGDTVMVEVSAVQKMGINDLLEMILLVADMRDLKANPNRPAMGTVIEAKLDRGRGPVATVLINKGTLRIGDSFLVGEIFGRVRAMANYRGRAHREPPRPCPWRSWALAPCRRQATCSKWSPTNARPSWLPSAGLTASAQPRWPRPPGR